MANKLSIFFHNEDVLETIKVLIQTVLECIHIFSYIFKLFNYALRFSLYRGFSIILGFFDYIY